MKEEKKPGFIKRLTQKKTFTLIIMYIVMVIIFSVWSFIRGSNFLTVANLKNILNSLVVTSFLTLGAGCLLIGGYLDLAQSSIGCFGSMFMATAIGLACGMGYVGVAALFFLVMTVLVLLLGLFRMGEVSSSYRHLKITIPETLEYDGLFDDLFAKYTSRHELVKVKTTNMGTLYELSYNIHIKGGEVSKDFIDELRCRNGNLHIVCGQESDKEML